MELIAERGLPVAPAATAEAEKPLAEAEATTVKVPLTDGFARTGYEQEQMAKAQAVRPE
jgi:hypothetical protein